MNRLLLTCNPGTEDIVAEEAREKLAATPLEIREMHGRLLVETPIKDDLLLSEKIYEMRTIHYAGLLLASGRVSRKKEGLDDIRRIVRDSQLERYIAEYFAYAVRSVREGSHEFTSMDVSRVVGDEIGRLLSHGNVEPRVRLNSPTIIFRADVIEDKLYLSLSLTGDQSRHIKGIRIFDHPAALKSSLAASMLRIAEYRDKEELIDPMCGSGTIALEAAFMTVEGGITCNDKSVRHIRNAKRNSLAAGVSGRIKFTVSDAIELLSSGNSQYDAIVSNPPYGIRMGDPRVVRTLYRRLAEALPDSLAPGGRAVIITSEYKTLERAVLLSGLQVTGKRTVRHGDLWVKILKIENMKN